MSKDWDDFAKKAQDEIDSYLTGRLNAGFEIKLLTPPTWTETVHEGWRMIREHWGRDSIDGRLVLRCDMGVLPDILYEQVRYGGTWVIEADGVIVERLAIHTR